MKRLCFLAAVLAGAALWGCGSGSGSQSNGNSLANGRAALNQVASGAKASDTPTLQSILDLFTKALQDDPNSTQAHFGAAVSLAGQIGNDIEGVSGTGFATPAATTGKKVAITRDSPTVPPGVSGGNTGSGIVLPGPPTNGDIPPAPPGHNGTVRPIEPPHTLGLLWYLDRGLANPYTLLHMLAPISDLRLGLIAYYGYPQDNTDVTRRTKLLTNLNLVLDHLKAVEADPNFTTTLPSPDRNGQTVTVGLPEVYLFDAYVNSLRIEVALSLAYVRDPGTSALATPPPNAGAVGGPPAPPVFNHPGTKDAVLIPPTSIYALQDKNNDGKLTPDEYLPASPYLTLRDAKYLTMAQESLLAIADKEGKGIDGILARPVDNLTFLVPNTAEVKLVLTEARDKVVPLIKQAATGPVTIEIPHYEIYPLLLVSGNPTAPRPTSGGNGLFTLTPVVTDAIAGGTPPSPPVFKSESVTINLAAWFNNPPADLKAFAPTYVLNIIGYPDFSKTIYPDSTYGGLYPNGLPDDLRF